MDRPATVPADLDVTDLGRQVAHLSDQVQRLAEATAYLVERTRHAELHEREWEDLKQDATPVLNDLYCVAVEQLGEIEPHVRLEEILYLFKRVARNTRTLTAMVDRLESLNDLVEDAAPLTDDMFAQAVATLDTMERRGYFELGREGARIVEKVATAFTEEDLRQLGDNVVLILQTVKEMTQPEIMGLMRNITGTYRASQLEHPATAQSVSLLSLVRQIADPETRRGLALALAMLRSVAQQRDSRTAGNGSTDPGSRG